MRMSVWYADSKPLSQPTPFPLPDLLKKYDGFNVSHPRVFNILEFDEFADVMHII